MTTELQDRDLSPPKPPSSTVLGMRVDATSYEHATRTVLAWAASRESRYVCISTVHMTMEAYDSPEYRAVVNGADLVTPDGMPMVWALRLLGHSGQGRVYGPDLTIEVLESATREKVPVAFYGGKPETLEKLSEVVRRRFPECVIAYSESPPFRPATEEERLATIEAINSSGARIVFVGLGCPKQERWMAANRGLIAAPMLGVGAAFDFHAGTIPQAPRWVMRSGLEWLFRLISEPRRLWKRYLKNNPRFVYLFFLQWLGVRKFDADAPHTPLARDLNPS